MNKLYLGDGVYLEFDGYALVLTTEDGINVTNRIVLEPEVYAGLVRYVDALKATKR
jgi:hypothetical protein